MLFGDYMRNLRSEQGLSQRDLADRSGVSNAEISRLESGGRKNPSPKVLQALAPYLGIAYEELMFRAGYIQETVEHAGYTEQIYRDEQGNIIDVNRFVKAMFDSDSDWANLAYRVSSSGLTEAEMELIKAQTKSLLDQFLKNRK